MSEAHAVCTKCGCATFVICEDKVVCPGCSTPYPFNFICPGVCETLADGLVMLINEGY